MATVVRLPGWSEAEGRGLCPTLSLTAHSPPARSLCAEAERSSVEKLAARFQTSGHGAVWGGGLSGRFNNQAFVLAEPLPAGPVFLSVLPLLESACGCALTPRNCPLCPSDRNGVRV